MIRVELLKMLRRPRTWVTILLLNLLPTIVAVLLALTDVAPPPGEGPAFLSAVLTDGRLFPLAALAIVLPLFMPVAVAVVAGESVADAAVAARELAVSSGTTLVHPYDDPLVVAGQGTVGLEVLEAVPDLDAIVAPVGGGGLAAGTAVAARAMAPRVEVVGVQSELFPAAVA